GVAHALPGEDGQVLREQANIGKKHAKERGKNCVSMWTPALAESVTATHASEGRATNRIRGLRLAILGTVLVIAAGVCWILTRPHHEPEGAHDAVRVAEHPSQAAPENSIAVLPFVDMSETQDEEYFSDGLAEELLDRLAKIPGVHVVARTSSFSFKGQSDD